MNEPLLIVSQSELSRGKKYIRSSNGFALLLSIPIAVILCSLGLAIGGEVQSFTLLGAVFPFLAWQDALRYGYFSQRAPTRALVMDAFWVASMGGGALLLRSMDVRTLGPWVILWGGGALLSAIIGVAIWGPIPDLAGALKYAKTHLKIASQMLGEFLISSSAQQTIIFLIPLVANLVVLASFKSAQVAIGPLSVLLNAGAIASLPSLSRSFQSGNLVSLIREARILAIFNVSIGLIAATVLYLMPVTWGEAFLGRSWVHGSVIAPIVALQISFIGVCQGAMFAMQATRNVGRSLLIRLFTAPSVIIFGLVGAYFWGIFGLSIGLTSVTLIAAILWWSVATRTIRAMENLEEITPPSKFASAATLA